MTHKVRVLVSHKLAGFITLPELPVKDDRIVLSNDRYTGYIVKSREFVQKENFVELTLHCRLDK